MLCATLALLGPLGLSAPALAKGDGDAKKEQVKKLFDDGIIQYDLGKFDESINIFEKAYAMYPDPAFLYNIAQAHRMAKHPEEAVRAYRTYLRKVPNAANKDEVNKWIAALEKGPPAPPAPPALPPMPPAAPYLEPKSKHSFMTRITLEGKGYSLTGVSKRTYIGFTLYGVALYVEEEPARRAFPKLVEKAGGSDLAQLRARDLAQNFVVLGEFGKAAMLYFVRDIPANKIRDSYRDMLKENLKPDVAPMLRQHTEQFLDLFSRDMKKSEEMTIQTTTDGRISVTVNGEKKNGPQDPTLCIDLWNLWIGTKAINADMKQGLVERIQALGGSVAPGAGK
jgi:tetratricopeptide (TPR) repeat protein